LLALLVTVLPLAAGAAPPALMLPLACALNRDCWIANHVDLEPAPGIRGLVSRSIVVD
jgi:hypothetical protein